MHQGAVPDRLRRVCVHVHWHCGPRTLSRTDNLPGSWPDSDEDGIGNACDWEGTAMPNLSEWGMIIFMTIILGMGIVTLVRRREV